MNFARPKGDIRSIADNPAWTGEAAEWFSEKWGIPAEAYRESMEESSENAGAVPQWYVVREDAGPSSPIIAGCGIIENDVHETDGGPIRLYQKATAAPTAPGNGTPRASIPPCC